MKIHGRRRGGPPRTGAAPALRAAAQRPSWTRPRGVLQVKVGGGPTTREELLALIQVLREHGEEIEGIQQLGGRYSMPVVVLDEGDSLRLGLGLAWGPEHGWGTANSGAPDVLPDPPAGTAPARAHLLDHRGHVGRYLGRHEQRLRKQSADHPACRSLMSQGFGGWYGPPGQPATDVAVTTRAELGREAQGRLFGAWSEAVDEFPFLRIFMLPGQRVEALDLSDPVHPRITSVRTATGEVLALQADEVSLNTGTRLVHPVRDEAVRRHTYCGPMNLPALRGFLGGLGLLEADGCLKPGARLALGGSGLSAVEAQHGTEPLMRNLAGAHDASPATHRQRELVRLLGYLVRPEAAHKYRGALRFVSKTEGRWVPPRHSHGPRWRDPLGTLEEQHALFLHRQGQQIFQAWAVLGDTSFAIAQHTTLSGLRRAAPSTKAVIQGQLERSLRSARARVEAAGLQGAAKARRISQAEQTLEGRRRGFALATMLGLCGTPEELRALRRKAPLSFDGLEGYPMYRARMKAVTDPRSPAARDNAPLMAQAREWMIDVTASPLPVHAAVALLFEVGIADHVCADYADLQAAPAGTGRPLQLVDRHGQRHEFDAFIVAPVFEDVRDDPIGRSLEGQVKQAIDGVPGHFEVGLHRQLKRPDGTPAGVLDNSLRGAGHVDARGNRLNASSGDDVHNLEGRVDVAWRIAHRHLAQATLAAAGFPQPVQAVEQLYQQWLRRDADLQVQPAAEADAAFAREAWSFEPHYRPPLERAAFCVAADLAAAGDAQQFARLVALGRSASSAGMKAALRALIERHRATGAGDPQAVQAALAAFEAALDAIEPYAPASRSEYYQRFTDAPLKVHERVLQQAFEMARERLIREAEAWPPDRAGRGLVAQHASA